MNKPDVNEAVKLAKEFIALTEKLGWNQYESRGPCYLKTGRKSAAVRRKSLDLTHALSDMRQPYRSSK